MTDAQKVAALVELLGEVINSGQEYKLPIKPQSDHNSGAFKVSL